MIVVKITERVDEKSDTAVVDFAIGETEGNAFSFAVEKAGTLRMQYGAWLHFRKALQQGARRPLVLLSEQADG